MIQTALKNCTGCTSSSRPASAQQRSTSSRCHERMTRLSQHFPALQKEGKTPTWRTSITNSYALRKQSIQPQTLVQGLRSCTTANSVISLSNSVSIILMKTTPTSSCRFSVRTMELKSGILPLRWNYPLPRTWNSSKRRWRISTTSLSRQFLTHCR